jgi:hypothetical protein
VARRFGAACGVAVPLVMWTALLVFGRSRRGFNLLTEPASLLGQVGTPNQALFNMTYFMLSGLLTVLFAGALYRNVGDRWPGKLGVTLIAVAGLSLVLSGVVAMTPHSPWLTSLHPAVGLPLLVGIPPALFLIGDALGRDRGRRGYARMAIGLALLSGILVVAYVVAPKASVIDGLFQRAYQALLTPWFIAVGLWLRGLPSVPSPGALVR